MKITQLLFWFVAGVAVGWFAGHSCTATSAQVDILHTSDTVVVRDTVRIAAPSLQSAKTIRFDTIRIPTDPLHDTILVPLPVQQLHYRDSVAEAWVSGYRPRLDSLRVFPERITVTNTLSVRPKPRRWHLGVTAGATVTPSGISPGVTIGLSYSILDF